MVGTRGRMAAVIAAVSATEFQVGAEDGERRRLWCSFSRTKEARANGAHAAWVRRTVRHLDPAAEERLETDYPSGTCWIGMAKIASAREQPGEGAREGDLRTRTSNLGWTSRSWRRSSR